MGFQREVNKQNVLQHINSVDPAIKFTLEDNKEDVTIPFLDTIVKLEADGKLSITANRKPTHMDQYLQWDSHHHLSAKYSVINTLTHRAKQSVTNLRYSQKNWSTSGKYSLSVHIPNGPWTGWQKGLLSQLVRLVMWLTVRALQAPNPLPMKLKQKVI